MGRKVFITSEMSSDEKLVEVAEEDSEAAVLWPWFLTILDDWGRAEASPKRLKAKVFPMFPHVTVELIEEALRLYSKVGLIVLYEIEDKRYMAIPDQKTWYKWQTHIRTSKREKDESRIPPPPGEGARKCAKVREDGRNCTPSPSPSPSPSGNKNICVPDKSEKSETAPAEKPKNGGAQLKAGKGEDYTDDFEFFWMLYPRKKEKRAAFKNWQTRLKEGHTADELITAAKHYAQECTALGTAEKFIKHAKTFLGPSKPFLDYAYPPPQQQNPASGNKQKMPRAFESLRQWAREGTT